MVFDREKIEQKIAVIEDSVAKLKLIAAISKSEFYSDFRNPGAAKYFLQIAIEATIDIANHIIARNNLGKPETHRQAFEKISLFGAIQSEQVQKCFLMSKFRNKIVHMYQEVDDEYVYNTLRVNLADFDFFVQDVRRFIG